MPSFKKKRRVQFIAFLSVLLAIASVLIGYGLREGISFFRTPAEVLADHPDPREVFRVGGLVEKDSVERVSSTVSFRLTDGTESLPITYTGILPDLFAEEQGAIALGTFDGFVFRATEVLARHDEKYIPKEVIDAMEDKGILQPVE